MKIKILALLIVLILAIASFSTIASALEISTTDEVSPIDSDVVELSKMIKDSDTLVNEKNADIGDIVRFNIAFRRNTLDFQSNHEIAINHHPFGDVS